LAPEERKADELLDEFGRTLDPDFFQSLGNLLGMLSERNPKHGLSILDEVIKIPSFVYDANVVQSGLRWELKNGVGSDIFNIARSGFIKPIAPKLLDEEIANHASDMARDLDVSPAEVLRKYFVEVRPLLSLVDVESIELITTIRAELIDKDDAPYLAVHLERETAGVVTNDKGVTAYLPKDQVHTVKDICEINIVYRKQHVVLMVNIVSLAAFSAALYAIFVILSKFWKQIAVASGVALGFFLLWRLFDKESFDEFMSNILQETKELRGKVVEVLVAVQPFINEYIKESTNRTKLFKERSKNLPASTTRKESRLAKKQSNSISYFDLLRTVFLAHRNKPMREKDICSIVEILGYPVKGKNSNQTKIRSVLKIEQYFSRSKSRHYTLKSLEQAANVLT
jgi:hypothetical protein